MAHHHHHRPDRWEQDQIDQDEQMAAQMQAQEERGYSDQGSRMGYPGQQYQPQYESYNQGPPQGYSQGPGQGYNPRMGYNTGPPPQNYGQYNNGPPQQYQNYQQGPPHQYQQGPSHQYQQGPPQQYQQGPPHQYQGGPPHQAVNPMHNSQQPLRRKSLLIGINYTGTQHALRGCQQDVSNMMQFLNYKGYSSDSRSQVVMRDDSHTDPNGPFWPTGHNILAAMHWLISEPGTCNFLHYSGHGGQVRDPDGDRDSGFDDTIVPLDFERNGQLDSDKLHRTLISALPPNSTLFVIFDCCHSGSAIELPFVYRSDADGNVSMVDNVKAGVNLLNEASHLIQGGFSISKLTQAKDLFSQASTLFNRFQHPDQQQEEGVGEEHFVEDWKSEHKFATMFSGCRDDQTSADANIGGQGVGAMSWAFLEVMKRNPNPTYLSTLQQTRQVLGQSHYKQVPQLSIGFQELDLDQPLRF